MSARAISIGPDKFLLLPGQEGSVSHQPLRKFRELYGIHDEITMDIFVKLFRSDISKEEQAQRMRELTAEQKSRLLTALDKRIRDMVRDLRPIQAGQMTLSNTVVMTKLSKIKEIRDTIAEAKPGADTSGLGRPPMTGPDVPDVLENEIVKVSSAKPSEVAHAKQVRANLFQRIMIIAYYLAHPVQLHRRDPQLYDKLRELVEGLMGPKTPAQLTKMVTMIQEGATSDDIRRMDPLNYFERVSMSEFLESPELEAGATNTIINPLKESTQEKIMKSYVEKLMALLQINRTVNPEDMKALKDCLKGDESVSIDKGRRAKGVEMGQKLNSAIQPLYEAFGRLYSPLFGHLDGYIRTIQPIPSMEIMHMLKIFTNEQLPDGIYKYTNVPTNVMELFNKINTNYALIQQYVSQLKLKSTNKIQAVYLHDNLPIPNTTGQIVFKQLGGASKVLTLANIQGGPNTPTGLSMQVALAKKQLEAESSTSSAKTVAQTSTHTGILSNPTFAAMTAAAEAKRQLEAKSTTASAKPASAPATPPVAAEEREINKGLQKEAEKITKEDEQQAIIRLKEVKKQELLNKVKTFFADRENTLYIMSGKELTKIPIALFTVSAESKPVTVPSTPEYTHPTMKVGNIFPSISNSKPVLVGTVMLAGFIGFAKSLKTIADEPVPAPEPASPPAPPAPESS